MNRAIIYLTFIWIFITQSDVAFSQDSVLHTSRNYGWVDAGIQGFGSPVFFDKGGGVLAFSFLSGPSLYTGRFIMTADILGNVVIHGNSYETNTLYEFGVLYGRALNSNFLFASASAGISIVSWRFPVTQDERTMTVGFPFEIQAFVIPLPALAIGVKCIANVNNKYLVTGGFICIRAGILRYIPPRKNKP